jgi:hypothetical protein
MYTINVTNESPSDTTFIIFQKPPQEAPDLHALAWKTSRLFSGQRSTVSWEKDYSFFSAQTGMISPGIVISPVSQVNASFPDANEVSLESDYQFSDPYSGLAESLAIR